jgi:hypothetical protein
MLFLLVIFFLAPLAGINVFGWAIAKPVRFLEQPIVVLLQHQP